MSCPRITVRTICYFASESKLNSRPGFPYYPKFLSLFKTPRQGVHAATRRRLRVSRTLSNSRSFVPRAFVYTWNRKQHGFPEIKRSSKFFLRSNDLDKLKSTALKPRDIHRRRFFKRAGFACFQEIKQRHPGQQEARPTINYIISIDPHVYRLLSRKHFRSVRSIGFCQPDLPATRACVSSAYVLYNAKSGGRVWRRACTRARPSVVVISSWRG